MNAPTSIRRFDSYYQPRIAVVTPPEKIGNLLVGKLVEFGVETVVISPDATGYERVGVESVEYFPDSTKSVEGALYQVVYGGSPYLDRPWSEEKRVNSYLGSRLIYPQQLDGVIYFQNTPDIPPMVGRNRYDPEVTEASIRVGLLSPIQMYAGLRLVLGEHRGRFVAVTQVEPPSNPVVVGRNISDERIYGESDDMIAEMNRLALERFMESQISKFVKLRTAKQEWETRNAEDYALAITKRERQIIDERNFAYEGHLYLPDPRLVRIESKLTDSLTPHVLHAICLAAIGECGQQVFSVSEQNLDS